MYISFLFLHCSILGYLHCFFSHTYMEDHQLVGVKEPGKNGGDFLGQKVSTSIARTLIPIMRELPLWNHKIVSNVSGQVSSVKVWKPLVNYVICSLETSYSNFCSLLGWKNLGKMAEIFSVKKFLRQLRGLWFLLWGNFPFEITK